MPTSGTHITVVEQVALSDPKLMALLGDPKADPDTPEGTMMRFAKLGAVGPDVFYMLGDFNDVPATELQNLENFLVKVGGTTACISDLSERVNKWLTGELDKITAGIASELQQTSTLLSGIVTNGFMALLVDSGVNVWSFFRSPRQQDLPRQNWFWADCLHYEYTGRFAKQLLNNARKTGNKNLYAYALGYLTHYVTDVVGHPYVNQVVQGPYRMHWQRHHLVENFIDAYTWDRWHVQQPDPGGSEERPLDLPTGAPNPINSGAPALMSRLHDHINVGESSLGDPVDAIIEGVCQKIEKGLFDIGMLEKLDMDAPEGDDFKAWTELMVKTLQDVYTDKIKHPTILAGPPDPRPNGYPLPEDVAGAYGVLRLLLKISTEADVEAPVFPDIVGDITKVIEDTMQKVSNDIGGIPPFPTPNTSGSFSLDALLDALSDIAQWLGEVLEGVGKALVDLIAGIAGVGETLVVDSIKVLLWLLNSALYAMYRYFRDVLVLNAYSLPYTDELAVSIGGVRTGELWTSMGNLRTGQYPAEENPNARLHVFNPYRPYIQPALAKTVEMPPVAFTAPYGAGSRPEAFLETAAGPDNMFNGSALQTQVPVAAAQGETTFTDTSKQFGGAIKNSAKAILAFETIGNDLMLPDFDMDGDRGYAWPCWQVDPTNPTLLDPTKVSPVHVDAVEITD